MNRKQKRKIKLLKFIKICFFSLYLEKYELNQMLFYIFLIVYRTFDLIIRDVGKDVENRNLYILLVGVKINIIDIKLIIFSKVKNLFFL